MSTNIFHINYPSISACRKTRCMIVITGIIFIIQSCGHSIEKSDNIKETITPVTVTGISTEPMTETIVLNAVSGFLRKNIIKASVTGIIESININPGDEVEKDQVLFSLLTKEAAAFEKHISADTVLNFKGEVKIKSAKSGVISSINHQKGDYVQEGEELAQVSEQNSLVFILEVPFELRKYIKLQGTCKIQISDDQSYPGTIIRKLPAMDEQSQTENYIVIPTTSVLLPEKLIVKIFIIKNSAKQTQVLPKQAILANESLTEFWVMKLINDSTAVKTPVKKGMESNNKIEILYPVFSKSDRIILTGNYGLNDTARVIVK